MERNCLLVRSANPPPLPARIRILEDLEIGSFGVLGFLFWLVRLFGKHCLTDSKTILLRACRIIDIYNPIFKIFPGTILSEHFKTKHNKTFKFSEPIHLMN